MNQLILTIFTIITGLVTLAGFFFQIKDLYPDYRRYYSLATFFLFGVTFGLGISTLSSVTINLPDSLSAKNIMGFILFGGTGLLIFLCFAASALITDNKRRSEISKIGSAVSGFMIFLLIFFYSSFFPLTQEERPQYLTYGEQIETAMNLVSRNSYDRALVLLTDAKVPLSASDPRLTNLTKLIEEVHRQQADFFMAELKNNNSNNSLENNVE